MNLVDYVVPITVFIALIASSWDWMWETDSKTPSIRGGIAILCGLIALFYGWQQYQSNLNENRRLLETVERQSRRLIPSDFQVKLQISVHVTALTVDIDYEPPTRIGLFINIGNGQERVEISGAFVLREPIARERPGGRNPNKYWNYYGSDLYVDGLSKLPYLDQLEGKSISIYLPRRTLGKPFSHGATSVQANISIKGRDFFLKSNSVNERELITNIPVDSFKS